MSFVAIREPQFSILPGIICLFLVFNKGAKAWRVFLSVNAAQSSFGGDYMPVPQKSLYPHSCSSFHGRIILLVTKARLVLGVRIVFSIILVSPQS